MLVSYNWLKEFVNVDISPKVLADIITMGSVEVEEVVSRGSDTILNLAPTPNRGDCLSIIGVARDVAALTGKKVNLPKFDPPKGKGKMADWVEIIVRDKKASPRYTSRVVDGVKIGPSPDWLRKRVESAGVRSINNVVDATNYVLMELGQPVHAFDLRFLKGPKLIIDRPKKGCRLKTLDEAEYDLTPDDILNLDADRPIGVAGIMGGENSGVTDDTTTLVLESAYFDPISVRKTSKRTGLVSESSRRFEKGVDPEGVIQGLHRLTELVVKVAGGVPSIDWVDFYPDPIGRAEIDLTTQQVGWLLGTDFSSKVISRLLEALGCEIKSTSRGEMRVVAPSHRPDITRPVDLIEEVARLYGYDKIEESMPVNRIASLVTPLGKDAEGEAREALIGLGFYEAITYSFSSEAQLEMLGGSNAVKLANPLTADMVYMRTSIIPALLQALENNLNRQIDDVKLFELNSIFLPREKGLPLERANLAGVLTGRFMSGHWEGSSRQVDLFDAKAAAWSVFGRLGLPAPDVGPVNDRAFLHPVDSFEIFYPPLPSGERAGVRGSIGFCGRLHPQLERDHDFTSPVYIFELDFDTLKDAYLKRKISYRPVSKYPVVVRDVALLVGSRVTHKELMQSFNNNLNKLVQHVELFDIYKGKGIGEGKKSMAYRIWFGLDTRTLSDEEVDDAFSGIVDAVKKEIGAEIR